MEYRYSAIETSYRCLQKHNLIYRLGIRPESKSADLAFGTTIHSAISVALQDNDMLGAIDPLQLFETQWALIRSKDMEYSRNDWDTLRDMGLQFISKFLRLHKKKYAPIHIEKTLSFFVGDYRFTGTPDCIANVDGELAIIDWKTSGFAYPKDKIIVSEQMWLYAHAAKQALGLDIKKVIYVVFCKTNERRIQTVEYPVSQEKIQEVLTNVSAQCKLIESATEYPKNRASCLMGEKKCEFFDSHCYKKEGS